MKKIIALLLLAVLFIKPNTSHAQLDSLMRDSLRDYEIRIQGLAEQMVNNPDENTRITSIYFMIKNMVKMFKIPGSYYYPLDSVTSISVLYPDDKTFRILTWHLVLQDGSNRQYGVIQMNPDKIGKGKKKKQAQAEPALWFPLIDRSDSLQDAEHLSTDNEHWWGGHYYKIVTVKHKKKTYYTLLGYDGNNRFSNRKVIDVLSFEEGKPKFGSPIFKMKDQSELQSRIIFEFDEAAAMMMRWQPEESILVYDHLIPKDENSWNMKKFYVPDGSFDYLKYDKSKGLWQQYEKYSGTQIKTIGDGNPTK
jgi:hypothetical protein